MGPDACVMSYFPFAPGIKAVVEYYGADMIMGKAGSEILIPNRMLGIKYIGKF